MGYIIKDNQGLLVTRLTDTGRKKISEGNFNIAYFQIGDNPGRNEPGTGEMNYKNIFKHISGKGYKGILGMEHGNATKGVEGEAALIKAYRDADSF